MDCETHLRFQRRVLLRLDEILYYWEGEEGAARVSISTAAALYSRSILEYDAQTAFQLNQNL